MKNSQGRLKADHLPDLPGHAMLAFETKQNEDNEIIIVEILSRFGKRFG